MKELKRKFTCILSMVFVLLLMMSLGLVANKNHSQAAGDECIIISSPPKVCDSWVPPAACNSGATIPLTCNETKDVILDGSNTVINISGKRYFKSLIIKNGATLTSISMNGLTDIGGDRVTMTPSGLLKKIDIETEGDITLENGGNINVDGAGYPETTQGNDSYIKGFGPSGSKGISSLYSSGTTGGGGNYGSGGNGYRQGNVNESGVGGIGVDTSGIINEDSFLPGSGAGSFGNIGSVACYGGGGRVHLKAKKAINISENSFITATGYNNTYRYDEINNVTRVASFACGGSGGGTVWLEAQEYSSISDIDAHADKAIKPAPITKNYNPSQIATNGSVFKSLTYNDKAMKFNINADGGKGDYSSANIIGGPGGGGKIYIVDLPPPPESRKVKVKVNWTENGQSKTFEMNEILGEIK